MVSGISKQNNYPVSNLDSSNGSHKLVQVPLKKSAKISPPSSDVLEKGAKKVPEKAWQDSPIFNLPVAKADKTAVATKGAAFDVTVLPATKASKPVLSAELIRSAEWQALTPAQKSSLDNDSSFANLSLTSQKMVAGLMPKLDDDAMNTIFGVIDYSTVLSSQEEDLAIAAVAQAKKPQEVAKELLNMLKKEGFIKAKGDNKVALLAQCNNFNNPHSIKQLTRLIDVKWFKKMDLPDRQRAAKSIAYMAEISCQKPGSEQNKLMDNTMNRLLSGEIPLHFATIDEDPGSITFGYAPVIGKGIYINKEYVPAGNDPFPKDNKCSRHAVLATIPHETSHQVNGDINLPSYKYFQAEYRAWYVGWIAEYGTPPDRLNAYYRCIDLFDLYTNIEIARNGTILKSSSKKVVEFMQQFSQDTKLDPADPASKDKILELVITNPYDPAPLPDLSLKPDMDN